MPNTSAALGAALALVIIATGLGGIGWWYMRRRKARLADEEAFGGHNYGHNYSMTETEDDARSSTSSKRSRRNNLHRKSTFFDRPPPEERDFFDKRSPPPPMPAAHGRWHSETTNALPDPGFDVDLAHKRGGSDTQFRFGAGFPAKPSPPTSRPSTPRLEIAIPDNKPRVSAPPPKSNAKSRPPKPGPPPSFPAPTRPPTGSALQLPIPPSTAFRANPSKSLASDEVGTPLSAIDIATPVPQFSNAQEVLAARTWERTRSPPLRTVGASHVASASTDAGRHRSMAPVTIGMASVAARGGVKGPRAPSKRSSGSSRVPSEDTPPMVDLPPFVFPASSSSSSPAAKSKSQSSHTRQPSVPLSPVEPHAHEWEGGEPSRVSRFLSYYLAPGSERAHKTSATSPSSPAVPPLPAQYRDPYATQQQEFPTGVSNAEYDYEEEDGHYPSNSSAASNLSRLFSYYLGGSSSRSRKSSNVGEQDGEALVGGGHRARLASTRSKKSLKSVSSRGNGKGRSVVGENEAWYDDDGLFEAESEDEPEPLGKPVQVR